MDKFESVNTLFDRAKHWKACGNSTIRVRQKPLRHWGVLFAAGFLFDTIKAISNSRSPEKTPRYLEGAQSWANLAHEYRDYVSQKARYVDQKLPHVWFRTWCGGMVDDQKFVPEHTEAAEGSEEYESLIKAANRQYETRRFVVTEKGYVGIVPDSSDVGDRIAILASGSMPFVLRRVDSKHVRGDAYVMIGGCYVDGR